MKLVCERIKEIRKEKGLTQMELANLIDDPKINKTRIGQYECGNRIPRFNTLTSIASALEVSVNVLLGDDDMQNSKDDYDERIFNEVMLENLSKDFEEKYFDLLYTIKEGNFNIKKIKELRNQIINKYPEYLSAKEIEIDALANAISKVLERGPLNNAEKIKEILTK